MAYFQPVTRAGVADILCRAISRDVIAALRGADLIATGPRSPQPRPYLCDDAGLPDAVGSRWRYTGLRWAEE